MTAPKPHIDVLLVVPLAVELQALYRIFPYDCDIGEETFQFTRVNSPNNRTSVAVIKLKDKGKRVCSRSMCICFGTSHGRTNHLLWDCRRIEQRRKAWRCVCLSQYLRSNQISLRSKIDKDVLPSS